MAALSDKDMEVVRRTPLFADLSEENLARLLDDAWATTYPRGHILFVRGDPVDRFFISIDGWVKVFRDTPEGEQSVVAIMKPGEAFAQAAIFTGRTVFPASAEVVEDARMIEVPASSFVRCLEEDSRLAIKMLGALSERLVQLVQHIEQLQFRSTAQRLADFLTGLTEAREGPVSLTLPYDKSLVAARLGMKPESLSRALAKLRKEGVSTSGHTVKIDDIGALREFAEGGEEE